jgi:superfamily II DNA or RNA helicase
VEANRVILGANILVRDPGPAADRLRRLATFRRRGRIPRGEQRFVRFYRAQARWLVLPRGLLPAVRQVVGGVVVDRRLVLPAIDFHWCGQLWPEQAAADRALAPIHGGVLVGPPGSGKTTAALALIAVWRQPALWIVNTRDLARQAIERARTVYNLPPVIGRAPTVGYIGEGSRMLGTHLTVATVQTLTSSPGTVRRILGRFGTVVVDETHMVPATTVARLVTAFPALNRLGVTATPYRSDGLDDLMFAILGSATAQIDRTSLLRRGRILMPHARVVPTTWTFVGGDWSKLQRARAMSSSRNRAICSLVAREHRDGRKILVLVERVAHARLLAQMLRESWGTPAYPVVGSVPPATRRRAYARAEAGSLVLIATRLADQGLDLPAIDCLVLATPGRGIVDGKGHARSAPRLNQQVGRIMRALKGKETPILFDFSDLRVDTLRRQAQERFRAYRQLGIPVERHLGG